MLAAASPASAQVPGPQVTRGETIRSASEFLSPELRREQDDETLNRGMLWVDAGRDLWRTPAGSQGKACHDCHGRVAASMRGVATRYPAVDQQSGRLLNLELRINECRSKHQGAEALEPESDDLLALTALLAHQSRGLPMAVDVEGPAATFFAAGEAFWHERQGQLDLACAECHRDNVGSRLRADVISSGIATGYPAYRLTWQGLGSLHRRLKACQQGVRAREAAFGSTEHVSLELYLAWRGRGHAVEVPGIRR